MRYAHVLVELVQQRMRSVGRRAGRIELDHPRRARRGVDQLARGEVMLEIDDHCICMLAVFPDNMLRQ
jgi:hypothetical protein